MSRMSRGCLRCRQRRVKCDERRPACIRCVNRNEVCEGYRDPASLIFRDQTGKTVKSALKTSPVSSAATSSRGGQTRSRSTDRSTSRTSSSSAAFDGPCQSTRDDLAIIKVPRRLPWVRNVPGHLDFAIEDEAASHFMQRYVMYPCNQTSSPGFLEHLPSLFKEANIEGRQALRLAVRAASYADLSRDQTGDFLARKAYECYGQSLSALGDSLSHPGKVPDDYDLMTVVMLDICETIFVRDPSSSGTHAQGMAQILRLRGTDQIYDPRGWSLFRLAHHRIQKQQLAFGLTSLGESETWMDQLDDNVPFVRLEKDVMKINQACQRARDLQLTLSSDTLSVTDILGVVTELLRLDHEATSWRQTPRWSFKTIAVSDLPPFPSPVAPLTTIIELHADMWMAYEWNYHRAARIVAHEHILKCLKSVRVDEPLDYTVADTVQSLIRHSVTRIYCLAEEILSSVPQFFGDVDQLGRPHPEGSGPPACRGIGGYLLLWPIKVIKESQCPTTPQQKESGEVVFQRIREYTGMKSHLGDLSNI